MKINTITKKGTHFTWEERLILEKTLRDKKKRTHHELAEILGKHKRTIMREIKRGWNEFLNSDLSKTYRYSPDLADKKDRANKEVKGPDFKLGNDFVFVNEVSKLMVKSKFSPDAVILHFTVKGWPTDTRISTKTLYRYIDEGLIPNITRNKLLRNNKRSKKGAFHPRRHSRGSSASKSISTRPDKINTREEIGHWEMDCVVSGKNKGLEALLVLTERKTRYELIFKIPNKTTLSVVNTVDKLERSYGSKKFREIFKSITCDNGSEFMDYANMERSVLTKQKRTRIYYAHPYCSSERGSNEVANAIIRRFIPKGAGIKEYTNKYIREIQDWMNNYPRRILQGYTAGELFNKLVF
jgi:IS30 family transposase